MNNFQKPIDPRLQKILEISLVREQANDTIVLNKKTLIIAFNQLMQENDELYHTVKTFLEASQKLNMLIK